MTEPVQHHPINQHSHHQNQVQPYQPNAAQYQQNQAPMPNVMVQQPVAPTVMQIQTQLVTSQPQPLREWSTDLFACCVDFKTCCCAICCLGCLVSKVNDRMGECCCVPYLPGGMLALRTKMRERYRIQGGIFKDNCIIYWCGLCSICQMDRELNIMEQQGQFCRN
ncbi:cornifelin-like [Lineus longissimus]|uniref:cornifelin-like n=1 Tax=Lineus longissimus TaxID=88925 RepID=UPI002B4F4841